MRVSCQNCATSFEVEGVGIGPDGLTTRCVSCDAPIHVERTDSIPAGQCAVRKPDGSVLSFDGLAELQQLLIDGRARRTDQMSLDMQTWQPIEELEELQPFLSILEKAQKYDEAQRVAAIQEEEAPPRPDALPAARAKSKRKPPIVPLLLAITAGATMTAVVVDGRAMRWLSSLVVQPPDSKRSPVSRRQAPTYNPDLSVSSPDVTGSPAPDPRAPTSRSERDGPPKRSAPSARRLTALGDQFRAAGQIEEAVRMYKRAAKVLPTADRYAEIGTLYIQLKRYDEALEAFQSALSINPRHSYALNGQAVARAKLRSTRKKAPRSREPLIVGPDDL